MNAPQLPREASALETIGHLKQKVCLMWGSTELDIFISRLIMDSRDGQRQGLPMPVATELLFLAQTNKLIRAINLLSHENLTLKEAFRVIDQGDQQRLEADALDNPLVSRDTIIREKSDERRSGLDRRGEPKAEGAVASFGQLIFRFVTSQAFLYVIGIALTVKLLWPYFGKVTRLI
jgi:hypothetical protein